MTHVPVQTELYDAPLNTVRLDSLLKATYDLIYSQCHFLLENNQRNPNVPWPLSHALFQATEHMEKAISNTHITDGSIPFRGVSSSMDAERGIHYYYEVADKEIQEIVGALNAAAEFFENDFNRTDFFAKAPEAIERFQAQYRQKSERTTHAVSQIMEHPEALSGALRKVAAHIQDLYETTDRAYYADATIDPDPEDTARFEKALDACKALLKKGTPVREIELALQQLEETQEIFAYAIGDAKSQAWERNPEANASAVANAFSAFCIKEFGGGVSANIIR